MRFQIGENYTEAVTVVAPIYSVYDSTANDSDKTFTVPDGETWKLNWVHLILVSTAAVGNRQIEMVVSDEDSHSMFSVSAGVVQAANATREYHFVPGTYRETAFVATELQVPFGGDIYMPAGWSVRFRDSSAIAVASDDLTVAFQVMRFKGA